MIINVKDININYKKVLNLEDFFISKKNYKIDTFIKINDYTEHMTYRLSSVSQIKNVYKAKKIRDIINNMINNKEVLYYDKDMIITVELCSIEFFRKNKLNEKGENLEIKKNSHKEKRLRKANEDKDYRYRFERCKERVKELSLSNSAIIDIWLELYRKNMSSSVNKIDLDSLGHCSNFTFNDKISFEGKDIFLKISSNSIKLALKNGDFIDKVDRDVKDYIEIVEKWICSVKRRDFFD